MCWLEPKNINFGKDIRKIEFKEDKVIKYFKNNEGYQMTLNFLEIMKDYSHYPKLLNHDKDTLMIEMENCGDLLSVRNLPNNWEEQFNEIRKSFIDKGLYILDLRFMPFTPLIINNVCIKNNKIYLVDLVMYRKRDKNFINNNLDNLIKQIKLYKYYINYLPILTIFHIYYEIKRLLISIHDRIIYQDIN